MRTVHICGLFRQDLNGYDQADLSAGGAQIWTVNDWYRCYPWMMPDRLFNPHFAPHINEGDDSRFPGDWRAKYNELIASGGKISVVELIEGVNPEGQELIPLELWNKFPRSAIGCSISLAICLAAYQGFQRIELRGVRLRDTEYEDQLNFVQSAIMHAQRAGVTEIINPYEQAWAAQTPIKSIDWTIARDVNRGSLKHLLAYSLGLKLDPESLEIAEQDLKKYTRRRRRIS